MSKHAHLHLSSQQRMQLEKLVSSGISKARTLTKARILLLTDYSTDHHMIDADIALTLQVSLPTIGRVRRRCLEGNIDKAVNDQPRSGKPPKITGDIEAQLVVLACSDPPKGHKQWTLRLLADRLVELELVDTVSHVTVSNRLKKTHLSLGKSNIGA